MDKIDNKETIKSLNHDLYVANKQIETLNVQISKQRDRINSLDRKLRAKDRDIDRLYLDQISRLEKANDTLADEKAELEKKLKLQEEYIKILEMPEDEEVADEIDYSKLAGRFLFIGGRPETVNELRKTFPAAVFTDSETDNVNLHNIDHIVMFTKFMSHALFYKYIDDARELGIQVIYCANTNTDMILRHIQKELS